MNRFIVLFITIASIAGCQPQGRESECISNLEILYIPQDASGPDVLYLTLHSEDHELRKALQDSEIEKMKFWKNKSLDEIEVTHSLKLDTIAEDCLRIYFATTHFRGYSVDTIAEKGIDFINTAQVRLESRNGKIWEFKTCD